MKRYWLKLKVLIIHILIRAGLIRNVWHKAELDLAYIEGRRLTELFGGHDDTRGNEH